MAKKDLIITTFATTGDFRPAAGVEIMITILSAAHANDIWKLHNGSNTTILTQGTVSRLHTSKIFITNNVWLNFTKGGAYYGFFGGIQVK